MGMLISEIEIRYPGLPCFDQQHPSLPEGTLPFTMDDLQTLYPESAAACKNDPVRMEKARRATLLLQEGHVGYHLLWQALRKISLSAQRKDIDQLGAHFDLWLGESDSQPSIPELIEALRTQGVAAENDGALVIDVSEPTDTKPMPPLLLSKSDGAALYATTDLATLLDRSRKFNPDRVVYVVDQRQALHFEQLFRAAHRTDFGKTMDLVHVGFGTVNGSGGKPYKTRQGGVARLSELLDEAIAEARKRLTGDAVATMNSDEREQLARDVALAAIKFADLQSHRLSGYIFDVGKLVSFEGRAGPYVQYACVRIASILAKARESGFLPGKIVPTKPSERAIVLDCARLPECVRSAGQSFLPNEIADFAFGLAQNFSKFYADCPVLTADTESERSSRLGLCALTYAVLAKSLWLLNIEVPQRM
jgi:arginyl-tRNA synthetase